MELFFQVNEEAKIFKESFRAISGNVTDADYLPVRRNVLVINESQLTIVAQTSSDSVTGDYYTEVIGGVNDYFTVLVIGLSGEPSVAKGHVQGILLYV